MSRCVIAYLRRNGEPYDQDTVCFIGPEKKHVGFEYVFTEDDIPAVKWTVDMLLEPGKKNQRDTKITRG